MKETNPVVKEIWTLIKENQKGIKELREVNQKGIKELRESQKETSQQIKRLSIETNQQIKENNEGLKKARQLFETQWGKLMESLVEGDLIKILNERGIAVKMTYMNVKSGYGKDQYEYDIIAGNGDEVVVVEVKTTLRVKHIKDFLEDIKKFSRRLSVYKNKMIYGAVAFLRAEEGAQKHAEKQGLFVVRATGDSACIINKQGFKPSVFS